MKGFKKGKYICVYKDLRNTERMYSSSDEMYDIVKDTKVFTFLRKRNRAYIMKENEDNPEQRTWSWDIRDFKFIGAETVVKGEYK